MARLVTKGSELALTAAKIKLKSKRPSRALFTKDERDQRTKLSSRKRYYEKKVKQITKKADKNVITFRDLRPHMTDDGSPSMAATLAQAGYFGPDMYDAGDFREHIRSHSATPQEAEALIRSLIDDVNSDIDDENARYSYDDNFTPEQRAQIDKYNEEIGNIDAQLTSMKDKAQERKNKEILKYLNKKSLIETGENILDAYQSGLYQKLTDPERAAINYAKNGIYRSLIGVIDFDKIKEEYRQPIKSILYSTIMNVSPTEGLKSGIVAITAAKVTTKYGEGAGELAATLAGSLLPVFGGKAPNFKAQASGVFDFMIHKSKWNKSLLLEQAEDLLKSPAPEDSTGFSDHNKKMLVRDVVVDVAKDVIMTGGNVFAAIPMVVKDILIDAGEAGVRQMAYDQKHPPKTKSEVKKQEENAKKAQKAFEASGEKPPEDEALMESIQKYMS